MQSPGFFFFYFLFDFAVYEWCLLLLDKEPFQDMITHDNFDIQPNGSECNDVLCSACTPTPNFFPNLVLAKFHPLANCPQSYDRWVKADMDFFWNTWG